jgi:glutamate---cysteine ligase / carboxylate-amine ligase
MTTASSATPTSTPLASSGQPAEDAFGSSSPFSVGVEEELFLVDPVTGAQINSSAAVLEQIGSIPGEVKQELHACQMELITGVCERAGEAIDALATMRQAVIATGVGLLGSGTHPSAPEGAAETTDKKRYERIRYLLGDAAVTPVGGLHVHVGMPDAQSAIRVFNGLREQLPLLQALAANSPYLHRRDTGLASAREVALRAWPRSGVPRGMRDFEDFQELAGVLAQAADVADYTWFWWKLRPHPKLGTVEIRALDAQASLQDTAALVALAHCLARNAAEAPVAEFTPPEILDEGVFRAARFGVDADLPDLRGRLRPVSQLLDEALALAGVHAHELGCEAELSLVPGLLDRRGGAGRQRRFYEIAGMDALLRELTQLTAG